MRVNRSKNEKQLWFIAKRRQNWLFWPVGIYKEKISMYWILQLQKYWKKESMYFFETKDKQIEVQTFIKMWKIQLSYNGKHLDSGSLRISETKRLFQNRWFANQILTVIQQGCSIRVDLRKNSAQIQTSSLKADHLRFWSTLGRRNPYTWQSKSMETCSN